MTRPTLADVPVRRTRAQRRAERRAAARAETTAAETAAETTADLKQSCGFCGHERHQVRYLVAAPEAAICDVCILLAVHALTDALAKERDG